MNINTVLATCPVVLDKEDNDAKDLALWYLPYSTGFEIECQTKSSTEAFDELGLLHFAFDTDEKRFRITNGLEGLKQLYNISQLLPDTMHFNPDSGIHYHVDCTDIWDKLDSTIINDLSPWILEELDTWNYQGTYNARKCEFTSNRYWTRFKALTKTMEFRIGEMAFDYPTLFKRITHANSIVRHIKYTAENPEEVINALYENPEEVIKKRIIKL